MLSLQYLGSRSHKIQPLKARSGPGNTGMPALLNNVIIEKCAIIIHFRWSINMGISNFLFNGVKMMIL